MFQRESVNDMAKTYKPGKPAPRRGEYEAVGPRGGNTDQLAMVRPMLVNLAWAFRKIYWAPHRWGIRLGKWANRE